MMSRDSQYEIDSIMTTATANNCSTADFTFESLKGVMAEFKAIGDKHLRLSAEFVEHTTCEKCGRKPTVTVDGYGSETVVICPHLWEALKRHPAIATSDGRVWSNGSPCLRPPLHAIRFEVFDDGPARW